MSDLQLLINGETPAKKNSRKFTRAGFTYLDAHFKAWHRDALDQIRLQVPAGSHIQNPVKITLQFIHGDYRRRDSDNGVSSILDLLVDAGVLEDDNWKIVRALQVFNTYQKDQPGCRVTIEELTIET